MPRISINGQWHEVAKGTSVAAAVMNLGISVRVSIQGEARNPLCGMGICFECRAMVDGKAHQRSCQIEVREGMEVITDAL